MASINWKLYLFWGICTPANGLSKLVLSHHWPQHGTWNMIHEVFSGNYHNRSWVYSLASDTAPNHPSQPFPFTAIFLSPNFSLPYLISSLLLTPTPAPPSMTSPCPLFPQPNLPIKLISLLTALSTTTCHAICLPILPPSTSTPPTHQYALLPPYACCNRFPSHASHGGGAAVGLSRLPGPHDGRAAVAPTPTVLLLL